MIVLHRHEWAFVSTPKAATNAMYDHLKTFYGGRRHGGFHCRHVPAALAEWPVFTACRNPYTRFLSAWAAQTQRPSGRIRYAADLVRAGAEIDDIEQFALWVADNAASYRGRGWMCFMPQTEWHAPFAPDTVLRIERLNEEMAAMPFAVDTGPIARRNTSAEHYTTDMLTPRVIDAVRRAYAADFEVYGYDPDAIPGRTENVESDDRR